MAIIAPVPPGLLPTVATAPGQPQSSQGPAALQAVTQAAAIGVRTDTRMAASASGNSGGSSGARGDKGKDSDNGASTTETRSNGARSALRRGPRQRGMGGKTDISV